MPDIEMPNGDIVNFPDEMPKEQIQSLIASKFPEVAPQPQETNRLEALGAGVGQGVTFGFGDEIQELANRGMANLTNNLGLSDIQDPKAWAAQLRQKELQELAALKQQHGGYYLGGEVLGALGTGATAAPKAITKGLTYAASKGAIPSIAAHSGLGALSGGVYGFGTGQGDAAQRARQALPQAGFGAIGGSAGLGVSRVVEDVFTGLANRAKNLFKKPTPTTKAVSESLPISGQQQALDVSDLVDQGLTDKGDVTTMLRGARDQDINVMRDEELARGGLLGDELQAMVAEADEGFKQSVKNTMQSLAGEGVEETSQDTLAKSIGIVKNRFDAQKRLQNKLMTARNDAIAKSSVYADYTRDTLGQALKELKKTPDFKVSLMREGNKEIASDFKIIDKIISADNVKSINMPFLASWRSGLNDYPKGSQQSVLAGKMKAVYDDWLDNHIKFAIKEGDDDLAEKIFSANSKYAEFKNKYGTNKYSGQKKVIENILTQEDMTPRAMVNTVFGANMGGKDYTEQFVKRLVQGVPEGEKRKRVVDGFRAGLFQKAFEGAFDETTDVVKFGKLKTNLLKMKKSDAYRKYLSSPEYDSVMDKLIVDLQKYQTATTDKSIVNLSGTTPMAARLAQSMGAIPLLSGLSLYRGGAESAAALAKMGTKAKNKRSVEKSLADFYKSVAPAIDDQIKFNFSGAGAIAGGVGSN
ncbi:MAG: hypothetical protein CBC71_06310 [Rhodobacteraceae bacterium TMED111]|nr:hypothetical protein [Marinovum sp.]OUV41111.1 MAG: hypothetical protein CBC71_06310 [Rhodobacteraceae bacterium TMED111]|tara:strand:+ start:9405 stop:11498 length:2094 start_codon:yes stop_codon:yes gene_type:complete